MKVGRHFFRLGAVVALFAVAGCSSSGINPFGSLDLSGFGGGDGKSASVDLTAGPEADLSVEPDDLTVAPEPGDDLSAMQCVRKCAVDLDCQNSCPAVPGGLNCCDSATNVCYSTQMNVCPIGPIDLGHKDGY